MEIVQNVSRRTEVISYQPFSNPITSFRISIESKYDWLISGSQNTGWIKKSCLYYWRLETYRIPAPTHTTNTAATATTATASTTASTTSTNTTTSSSTTQTRTVVCQSISVCVCMSVCACLSVCFSLPPISNPFPNPFSSSILLVSLTHQTTYLSDGFTVVKSIDHDRVITYCRR